MTANKHPQYLAPSAMQLLFSEIVKVVFIVVSVCADSAWSAWKRKKWRKGGNWFRQWNMTSFTAETRHGVCSSRAQDNFHHAPKDKPTRYCPSSHSILIRYIVYVRWESSTVKGTSQWKACKPPYPIPHRLVIIWNWRKWPSDIYLLTSKNRQTIFHWIFYLFVVFCRSNLSNAK